MPNERQLIASAYRCVCGYVLMSKHRHDFVTHTCPLTGLTHSIDGGTDYLKISGGYDTFKMNYTDVSVYSDAPHEEVREIFNWGGMSWSTTIWGACCKLKNMSTEHIKNVLRTQNQIKGTYVEDLMNNELEFRKNK